MIIFVIILLIITILIDFKKIKILKYKPIIKKENIWIYLEKKKTNLKWKSFYDRTSIVNTYNLNNLCLELIIKKNEHLFNINIITDENIDSFIPNFPWSKYRIDPELKLNYIKYFLLYTKGGLWIPSDLLLLKDFKTLYYEILHNDMILIKNLDIIDDRVIYLKSKLKVCKLILNYIYDCINKHYYGFENKIINILGNNININNRTFIFNNNINGYFDYNSKEITSQNLLSQNMTIFNTPKNVCFIHLNIKKLEKELNNNWILKLSKKNLFETNMWITKLFRISFNLKQKYYNTDLYKKILYYNSYELNSDIENISKKISSTYSPFLLVTKETSRNT